ncbi:MAG: SusC/RagA family TonB-linked outer membrane protein [Tenacibaculum sp.]
MGGGGSPTSSIINVLLVSDNTLDEIIIESAYNIKRPKPTVNSSITSIDSETIEGRPNASLVQTLQGQAPGVSITTGSGQPGSNSEIIIRGVGSISGNAEPLFIIDGVAVDGDNFRSLNSNNIASISILKDAGAKAIYGNRGSNGVVVIKTKSGNFNTPTSIEYSSLTTFSTLQKNNLYLMDSKRVLELERVYGNGEGAGLSDAEIADLAKVNTEWLDVFFRTGITQSHNLRISSGSDKTNTNINLGYFDTDGILVNSGLKRFNLDTKINGKNKNEKFNYGVSVSLNYSKNDIPNGIGSGAVNQNFVIGANASLPYISPSEYTLGLGGDIVPNFSNTPLVLLDKIHTFYRFTEELKSIISLNADYEIFKGLKAGSRLGLDYTSIFFTSAEAPNSFNAQFFAEEGNETPGFQLQQSNRTVSINVLNSLIYSNSFKNHTIDFGLYMEYFKAHRRNFGYEQLGLDIKTFSPGDGSGFIDDNSDNDFFVDQANASINNAGLLSVFVSADYDYNKKYGFGATLRRDASYRFRNTNKWGNFWSVSGRWNLDQEPFLENDKLNLLKLRFSYGKIGNQNILSSVGVNQYFVASTNTLDLYNTGSGYTGVNSIFVGTPSNPELKWETTTDWNIGLDFELFDKKLLGSIDAYNRKTTDLFAVQPTTSLFGTTSLAINSDGELNNNGVDLTLYYSPFKEDFKLTLNFAGNYNKSKRFGANEQTIREGGPLGEYYVIHYVGVNPATGNLLFLDKDNNITENPNEDSDRRFTNKTRYPDYQGSFGFEADYKGFFLSTNFTYVIGVDRFAGNYALSIDPTGIGSFRLSSDILRHWTPENRETDIPALRATNLEISSDRFLQSADYLRLRYVSFGYNFPKEIVKKFRLSKIKTYVNGENIFTLSGWRGFDAEGFASTVRTYPTPRILAFGFEIGF